MKFNKFTKINYNEIIPLIFDANLYFSIMEIGVFITAVIEILENLLFEDFRIEKSAFLISLKIIFNSKISFSSDFNINLNRYLLGHLEELESCSSSLM